MKNFVGNFSIIAKIFFLLSKIAENVANNGLIKSFSKYKNYRKPTSNLIKLNKLEFYKFLKRDNLILIIDHNNSGGAIKYRKNFIKLNSNRNIILLVYNMIRMKYEVHCFSANSSELSYFSDFDLKTMKTRQFYGKVSEILYNSLVFYYNPLEILELINFVYSKNLAKITVAVHDYFSICPSYNLINKNKKYCNLPDIKVCKSCLNSHNNSFVKYFTDREPENWRKKWELLLNNASEILCFSNSSVSLLIKAYPSINVNNIIIKKHSLESLETPIMSKEKIHIGILGNINFIKGGEIVRDLSKYLKMSGKDISISIIGNIEEKYKDDFMKEYGFYEVRDLPSILEKLSVNLIFMPSICPETFSYVTHEVIQMKIPLVCFNLGAQAEATISYNKGKVIPLNLPTEEIYRKIEKHFYDVRTQEKNVV